MHRAQDPMHNREDLHQDSELFCFLPKSLCSSKTTLILPLLSLKLTHLCEQLRIAKLEAIKSANAQIGTFHFKPAVPSLWWLCAATEPGEGDAEGHQGQGGSPTASVSSRESSTTSSKQGRFCGIPRDAVSPLFHLCDLNAALPPAVLDFLTSPEQLPQAPRVSHPLSLLSMQFHSKTAPAQGTELPAPVRTRRVHPGTCLSPAKALHPRNLSSFCWQCSCSS